MVADVNADGLVNSADRDIWVNNLKGTFFGDSTLEGEFDSGYLVAVFRSGEYEDGIVGNSTWAEGDWNGNGDFDSGDLIAAFQGNSFEIDPRTGVASVPENPLR